MPTCSKMLECRQWNQVKETLFFFSQNICIESSFFCHNKCCINNHLNLKQNNSPQKEQKMRKGPIWFSSCKMRKHTCSVCEIWGVNINACNSRRCKIGAIAVITISIWESWVVQRGSFISNKWAKRRPVTSETLRHTWLCINCHLTERLSFSSSYNLTVPCPDIAK